MKLQTLKILNQNFINLRQLITAAGLNYQSIMKRVERNSPELTPAEVKAIKKILRKIKIVLDIV